MNTLLFYESYYQNCLAQFEKYKEEEPVKGSNFSDLDLKKHLLNFQRNDQGKISFQTLKCEKENLVSISGMEKLSIINLFLSNNKLNNIDPILQMKNLAVLDLSFNQIKKLPEGFQKLKVVNLNLSNNILEQFFPLNQFKHLKILNLSHNNLRELENIEENNYLEYLDVSYNPLYTLAELLNLNQLAVLIANQTRITSLEGIQTMTLLRVILCNRNRIDQLKQLKDLKLLMKLDISSNRIKNLQEIENLSKMDFLNEVDFSNNDIHSQMYYSQIVLKYLTKLMKLDGQQITPQDYLQTGIFFGENLKQKKEIFNSHLPNQQFIDTRLIHSEMDSYKNLSTQNFQLLNVDFFNQFLSKILNNESNLFLKSEFYSLNSFVSYQKL